MVQWANRVNPHFNQFSRFSKAYERDQQTDRQTDRHTNRPRYSFCTNRPHLVSAPMRPNNNNNNNNNQR